MLQKCSFLDRQSHQVSVLTEDKVLNINPSINKKKNQLQ